MTLRINEVPFGDVKKVSSSRSYNVPSRMIHGSDFLPTTKIGIAGDAASMVLKATGNNARKTLNQLYGLANQEFLLIRSDTQKVYQDHAEYYFVPMQIGDEDEISPYYFEVPLSLMAQGEPGVVGVEYDTRFKHLTNDFDTGSKAVLWLPPQNRNPQRTYDDTILSTTLKTRTASLGDGNTVTLTEYDLSSVATPVEGDAAALAVITDPTLEVGGNSVRDGGHIKVWAIHTGTTTDYTVVDVDPLPSGWRRIAPGEVPELASDEVLLFETAGLLRILQDGRSWNYVGGVWEEKATVDTIGTMNKILFWRHKELRVTDGIVKMVMRPFIPHVTLTKGTGTNFVFSGFTTASDGTTSSDLSASTSQATSPDAYVWGTKTGQTGTIVVGFTSDNGWDTGSGLLTVKNTDRVTFGIIPEGTGTVEEEARRLLVDMRILGNVIRPIDT